MRGVFASPLRLLSATRRHRCAVVVLTWRSRAKRDTGSPSATTRRTRTARPLAGNRALMRMFTEASDYAA